MAQKKQRIRYEIACAKRLNGLGAARNADMAIIRAKYNISVAGVGGTRVMGMFYTDGDYWNA